MDTDEMEIMVMEGHVSFPSCPKQLPYALTLPEFCSSLFSQGPLYTNPSYQQFSGVIEWKYIHVGQLLEIWNTRNRNKMKPDYSSS